MDIFGPIEILGRLKEHYSISFYSLYGGKISNSHGVSLDTLPLEKIINGTDIFLIPGGGEIRKEVNHIDLIDKLKQISTLSIYVLTVCTESALLAKTRVLDGKSANF